ncbi:hypothetical protein PMAYCL1PPCAC_29311, partial [Pristionchus mayeri]
MLSESPDPLLISSSPIPDYGSTERNNEMGRSSKPLSASNSSLSFAFSFGMRRIILIVALVLLLAVVLSSLITYLITRPPRAFNPETDREDSIPDVPDSSGPSAESLRLPKTLFPDNYRIQLKVHLPGYGATLSKERNLTADVDLTIKMIVKEATNEIVLNSKEFNFTDDSFAIEKKTREGHLATLNFIGLKVEKELEKVIVHTEGLTVGETIYLKVKYTARILDILGGLYASSYKDEAGNTKIMAMTQMEPTDARRMVPCFDEPSFKATWDVSVEHPVGTIALSNGMETGIIPTSSGWQLTTFKQTPKMSSYLLAVVVGDLSKTETTNSNGVLIRVWARHETVEDTRYALEAGSKVLAHYDHYFGIKFPLEKMDMVACPDFSAGAMENWGLVTYRETDLLYNSETYGMGEKQRVATVVAHELAHQWFGNLVTMEWWGDLWLNEGFATLVEYDGTDFISDKNYHMEEEFVRDALEGALAADSLPTSQPLSFKIDKSIEVNEAFNPISYDKGGSVLRMIRSVLGPAVFQEGLKVYLQKHSYANAAAADLWAALQVAADRHNIMGPRNSPLNLHHFASQWTTQMGFPLVSSRRVNGTFVEFSQQRYKSTNATQERLKYRTPQLGFKWDIPLWMTRGSGDVSELFWIDRDQPLLLPIPENQFFVMNIDSYGFYRTHYGEEGWKRMGTALADDHK